MKILEYNILEGGGDRLPLIRDCIDMHDPDVCVLCEMNGWKSGDTIVQGYQLLVDEQSPSGYRLGIAAKEKITHCKSIGSPLRHGALIASVGELTLAAVHLSPFSERERAAEIGCVIKELEHYSGPLVLAGDLNSLSPRAHPEHERTQVVDMLSCAGFVDPLEGLAHDWTISTALTPDEPKWRVDYILLRNCGPVLECGVMHTAAWAGASDHWPITLTI
jgi:endonuclease/exonuclease/phosphatase family metal-dependent hydrolase